MSDLSRLLTDEEINEYLRKIWDESLPIEERRKSEFLLAAKDKLPEGYASPLEPAPSMPLVLPPNTVLSHAPVPAVDLSKLPPWGELISVLGSSIKRELVDWLMPDRIPLGKIMVCAGDMGLGKSWLLCWIMSNITRGGEWPCSGGRKPEPGSVIYMGAEDDAADTIVPRLEDMGADMNKVHLVTTHRSKEGTVSPFNISRDVQPLCDMLARVRDVRFVGIDPVADFLFGVDENKNAEVRRALNPLRDIARKFHAAFCLVNHLNKSGGLKALYRSAGSHAFVGIGRMNWLVCEHPFDKDRRVLVHLKGNLTAPPKGLVFRLTDGNQLLWDPEPVNWNADDVLRLLFDQKYREDGPQRGPSPTRSKEAAEFVLKRLAEGPAPKAQLLDLALELGLKESSFHKGVKRLWDDGRVRRHDVEGDKRFWLELAPKPQAELPLDGSTGA